MGDKAVLSFKIGFIGGGNMCKAIVNGLITSKVYPPSQIYINGPHPEQLAAAKEFSGCHVVPELKELIQTCDVLVLSIKPNVLDTVVTAIRQILPPSPGVEQFNNKIVVSVLAGVNLATLKKKFKFDYNWHVIRVMPNTPLMVGAGNVIYCTDPDIKDTTQDEKLIQTLFGSCSGVCMRLPEYQMNAATAITGCGPAFVYLMIDALADGGVKQGINKQSAIRFAAQTLLGAAQMVLQTGKHPIQLKDEVCSPGGTTIVGVHALEAGALRNTLMNAVEASTRKANDLDVLNSFDK